MVYQNMKVSGYILDNWSMISVLECDGNERQRNDFGVNGIGVENVPTMKAIRKYHILMGS